MYVILFFKRVKMESKKGWQYQKERKTADSVGEPSGDNGGED